SYVGKYLFSDLCGGFVRLMDPDSHNVTTFATGLQQPVDLQVGPDGALYYLQIGNGGQVWRVSFSGGQGGPAPAAGPVQASLLPQRVPAADGTDFDGDG